MAKRLNEETERPYELTGQKLKLALQKAGLSQTKLANEIHISREHCSNICNGISKLTTDTAKQVGEILGIDWLYLIGEHDYMNTEEKEEALGKALEKYDQKERALQELLKWYGLTYGDTGEAPKQVAWCQFAGDHEKYFLPRHEITDLCRDIEAYIFSRIRRLHDDACTINTSPYIMLNQYAESAQATLDCIKNEQKDYCLQLEDVVR